MDQHAHKPAGFPAAAALGGIGRVNSQTEAAKLVVGSMGKG
jgi:hypothetical protein